MRAVTVHNDTVVGKDPKIGAPPGHNQGRVGIGWRGGMKAERQARGIDESCPLSGSL